ncbi:MAG: hypothetical protein AAF074_17495 [Pseudomonadota bacterium]
MLRPFQLTQPDPGQIVADALKDTGLLLVQELGPQLVVLAGLAFLFGVVLPIAKARQQRRDGFVPGARSQAERDGLSWRERRELTALAATQPEDYDGLAEYLAPFQRNAKGRITGSKRTKGRERADAWRDALAENKASVGVATAATAGASSALLAGAFSPDELADASGYAWGTDVIEYDGDDFDAENYSEDELGRW